MIEENKSENVPGYSTAKNPKLENDKIWKTIDNILIKIK